MTTDYFGEGYFEEKFWRRSRHDGDLRSEMIRHLEEGWRDDFEHRVHLLSFLAMHGPAEGLTYVLRGLDEDDDTVRTTSLIALHSYASFGYRLGSALVERLKRIVEHVNLYSDRRWAFMILERLQPEWFGEWLRQFVNNEDDWAIRGPTLLYFVDRGEHDLLHDLIAALPMQDEDTKSPRSIWVRRNLVELSPREESILEDCVASEVHELRESHDQWLADRGRDWRRYPSRAALVLLGWLNHGVPAKEGDVRRAVDFIECRRRLYKGDRVEATKRLARLDHPAVVPALVRLTGSRFIGVRREAQKSLEELTSEVNSAAGHQRATE